MLHFEINIPESHFEMLVKDEVVRRLQKVVYDVAQQEVDKQIRLLTDKITQAVEVYLAKRLTDTNIKSLIDNAVKEIVESNLDRMAD